MDVRALRVLGMDDEQTTCDACGRVELRGTVILADEDGVEVGRFGTVCAGRVLGRAVTRDAVQAAEMARRQDVAYALRAARSQLAVGDVPAARWWVRQARAVGLHRPDELRVAAAIEDPDELKESTS